MRRVTLVLAGLSLLTLNACDNTVGGNTQTNADGGSAAPQCEASEKSGIWMQAFGPLTQEISTGGQAKVAVVMVHRAASQNEMKPAAARKVSFKIITQGGDGKLDAPSQNTDSDGLAEAKFTAGVKALGYPYQVQASAPGTCAITFSIDVTKPLRQLRILAPTPPGPFDTFTNARIPVTVEATTNNNGKLSDEKITFKTKTGKTSNTTFTEPGSAAAGSGELTIKTNAGGRATVMLSTGPTPIPQLQVVASMKGTADAEVKIRINKTGTPPGGCKTDADCPLGYYCKNAKCEKVPTTPAGGCKSDADCTKPNVCDKVSGMCVPPSTNPTGGCKSNSDCTPPNLCDTKTGKCLPPTGNQCDPVEGIDCPSGEVCVGRQCVKLPTGGCKDNSQCPAGFYCLNGKCVPNGSTGGGCTKTSQCPSGQVCVNGKCVPKGNCKINAKADRLKGTWKYDSKLYLRDALSPFMKGFFTASGYLGQIVAGSWNISGLPSFIEKLAKKYLKKLIGQYVPPWAQSLITTLAAINDIFKTMRVLSTVNATSSGQHKYLHTEVWDLIELQVNGKKISSPPSAIKQVGAVKVKPYLATETCGVLTINKHKINNQIGGIVLWAVNMALNLITCNVKGSPCYKDINQALNQSINCMAIGQAVDKLVRSIWSSAPPVVGIVAQACNSQKQKLVSSLQKALQDITVKLSLLELSGTATISPPPANNKLSPGKWYGVIGSGIAKGNFKGDFTATKQGP